MISIRTKLIKEAVVFFFCGGGGFIFLSYSGVGCWGQGAEGLGVGGGHK